MIAIKQGEVGGYELFKRKKSINANGSVMRFVDD